MAKRRIATDRIDAIYAARDSAVTALEEERYGDALRLLAVINDRRAEAFPHISARHQLMSRIADLLRATHSLMEDLGLDSDINEEAEDAAKE